MSSSIQDAPNKSYSPKIYKYWGFLVGSVTLVVIATLFTLICWALPRGFDWSDEAWVYSLIQSNRVSFGEPWGYQHVLHPVFELFGQSVLVFRILRVLGYASIALAGSFAFLYLAKSQSWKLSFTQKIILFCGAQFGTVIAFSYPPRYLSYNELASWLTQLFVVLATLIFAQSTVASRRTPSSKVGLYSWAGIGIILAIAFGAKITTFAVLSVLCLVLWVSHRAVLKLRLFEAMYALVGLLGGLIMLWLGGFPYKAYVENLLYVFLDPTARADYDHPVGELLQTYLGSIEGAFQYSWPLLLIISLSILFGMLAKGKAGKIATWAVNILLILISLWVAINIPRQNNWVLLGTILFDLAILMVALFFTVYGTGKTSSDTPKTNKNNFSQKLIFILIALGAPLGAAVGTNNPISGQMIFSATVWVTYSLGFMLVMSNLLITRKALASAIGLQITFTVFAIISIYAFAFDFLKVPYRTPQYQLQNSVTHANYVSGLLLTNEQANWADWISQTAEDQQAAGVPTVAISSPGPLLIFNNSPIASPWVASFWPVSAKSIAVGCSVLDTPPSDFFIIQDGNIGIADQWDQQVSTELKSCGFSFPEDFEVSAQTKSAVTGGMTTVWKLARETK